MTRAGACSIGYCASRYLASWAQAAELSTLERTAALIDRLARRIEDVLLKPIPAD